MKRKLTPSRLCRVFNLWPPFLFAGIRVERISDDWRRARVRMRLRWYNRNYVGTHFGGSLFAMTDPFWMILVTESLGSDYIVWDRAGTIDFIAPGRGDAVAEFHVADAALEEIRSATADGRKYLRWFETEITALDGSTMARVRKQLHIRQKRGLPPRG